MSAPVAQDDWAGLVAHPQTESDVRQWNHRDDQTEPEFTRVIAW